MNILKATLAALCLSATSAAAVPLGWSFDVTTGRGNVAGSFIYDADTAIFSDFDVTVTFNGESPVAVNNLYSFFDPVSPILWSTPTPTLGGIFVAIELRSPPTNAGGVEPAEVAAVRCTRLFFNIQGCGGYGQQADGSTTLTSFVPPAPVPLPASSMLLLTGFAALGWGASRRRKATGAQATA